MDPSARQKLLLDVRLMLVVVSGANPLLYPKRLMRLRRALLRSGWVQQAWSRLLAKKRHGQPSQEELDDWAKDLLQSLEPMPVLDRVEAGQLYGFTKTYLLHATQIALKHLDRSRKRPRGPALPEQKTLTARDKDSVLKGLIAAEEFAHLLPQSQAPSLDPASLEVFGQLLADPLERAFYFEWLRNGKVYRKGFALLRLPGEARPYPVIKRIERRIDTQFFARFQRRLKEVNTRPPAEPRPALPRRWPRESIAVSTGAARRALLRELRGDPALCRFVKAVGVSSHSFRDALRSEGLKMRDGLKMLKRVQKKWQELVLGRSEQQRAWSCFASVYDNKWGRGLLQQLIGGLEPGDVRTDLEVIASGLGPKGHPRHGSSSAPTHGLAEYDRLAEQMGPARLRQGLLELGRLLNRYRRARAVAQRLCKDAADRRRAEEARLPAVEEVIAWSRDPQADETPSFGALLARLGIWRCIDALLELGRRLPPLTR